MLGKKIQQLRKNRNMTLEELAADLNKNYPDTLNFNKGKLSKWENEKEEPKLSSARILADYFGVSLDYLLERESIREEFDDSDLVAAHSNIKLADMTDEQLKEIEKFVEYVRKRDNL
ncbi:XRE family transcriptional regulator [Listeria monocytogenes]|nr:XRE family transcriptional regulator [Listeria monocytogenes]